MRYLLLALALTGCVRQAPCGGGPYVTEVVPFQVYGVNGVQTHWTQRIRCQ